MKEEKYNLIKQLPESMNNNIDNVSKIWKIKWKEKTKKQSPNFKTNNEGRKIKNKEEIVKERLLQARLSENLQEGKLEQ